MNRAISCVQRHFTLSGVALAALTLGGTARAADTNVQPAVVDDLAADAASDAGGETIVVTASRRRDENVQDVPVAISVITAETLEKRGDFTLGQIQQQVPSLQVFSFNPRNTNINIRGLGSNVALTNDGLENGVGFYIDNVYYGRVGLSQFDLVDLQSIEVLRGPQGTLFGKNTTSGVVNITSKKPTFDPEFSGEATLGNYGFYQVRGSVSAGVLPDLLAVRISGAVSENDGFLFNKTTNTRAQNYRNESVRGQLLFTPTPDFELRIIGDYAKQTQDHVLSVFADLHTTYANGATIPNNFAARAARFPGYTLPAFQPFDRIGEADSHYQSNMEGYGVSGEANLDLGGAALTSITAYRWWDWNPANDGDSTSLPITTKAQQANRQRQFSQEVRLASQGNRSVDYVIGAYYFWQTVKGYGATRYGSAAALWNLPAVNQTIANAALNGFEANSTSTPETKTFALFGQTDWHLSDALTLTTGLRWSHEKKSGAFSQFWVDGANLSGFTPAQVTAINAIRSQFNPVTSFATKFTDNSLSGLVTLNWKVAPEANVYASYSRGNKSGGLNLTALPAGIAPDVAPEKVDAFELGFKSQFLDRRATFNAAAFWTEIRDYQTAITEQVPNTVNVRQYIANIPKVRSRGIEGDLAFSASDNFSVNASASYTDAKYVEYTNAPQAVENLNLGGIQDLSGKPLSGVPKFSYSIGADAKAPLGELGGREVGLYAHADYAHRSSFNTSATNSAWAQVPGFGIANARIGLKTDDGLWDLSVWARNLTGEDYFLNLTAANTGVVTAQVGDPRTFGVTLRTRL
ncbi:TonB-dependent receptor [Novosphingobium sp. MMS21-SN21R]|uniref:TonB-dependent receptor n=1 Tax=Novosphingobium sp. MMS21-SN21R TaxID=2969298 RepID=UPI002888E276|nr:TonB-dependent receptor [Novosphingobium sp. MMS21-SN21R]MDT0509017.1 TonB-dependent receptor [Novosphingobium sp. MMS21-SN21R]